jgi:hypothetical protein
MEGGNEMDLLEQVDLFCLKHYPFADDGDKVMMLHFVEYIAQKKLEQSESFDKNIIEIVWQALQQLEAPTQDGVEEWLRLFKQEKPEMFIHKQEAEKPINLLDLKERFKEWFTYDPSLATYSQVFFFLNEQPEFKKGE